MLARLEETIRSEIERSGLTGVAVALVKDGAVVEATGYGVESIDTNKPVAPETLFSIMSVTKTIVATALMQLHERVRFALDDPANTHLAPVHIQNQWENEAPVTIRQLMTHTSGLPVGIVPGPAALPLDDYVNAVAKTETRPGEAILYANWGYDAMGVLIERFSGQAVGEYLREAIFGPLGMTATLYGNPNEGVQRATGHYVSRVDRSVHTLPLPEWPMLPASPAGSCWSTVLDLAKFLIAHLNSGGPLLKPETAVDMHRLHAAQGATESGMGLGFRVTRSNGRRLICHGGDGGGFTAFVGAYPDEGSGVAVLINTGGMQVARSVIGNTALRLLAGAPERRAFAGASVTPGCYHSTFWEIEVEVDARDGEPPTLTTTEGLVVADEAGVSSIAPIAEGRFEGEGGMFHGFEVAFEPGETPTLSGGVYPFTFPRTGDLPTAQTIDESADLTGEWRGTVRTPMAPLAVTLRIENETTATLTTPLGPAVLTNFRAKDGRVEAEFPLAFPGIGDFHNFVRLAAKGSRLTGNTYARSNFGETALPTELDRT